MIRLMVVTSPDLPPQADRDCRVLIDSDLAEAAGIRVEDRAPFVCTRAPHPEGTLHVSHGTEACLVWGEPVEGVCQWCGQADNCGDCTHEMVNG